MSKCIKSENVKFKVSHVAYALIAAVAASASLTAKAVDAFDWTGGQTGVANTEESPYDIWNAANWGGTLPGSDKHLNLSVTEKTYIKSENSSRICNDFCPNSGDFVFMGPLQFLCLKQGSVENSTVSIVKKSGDWTINTYGMYIGNVSGTKATFVNESGNITSTGTSKGVHIGSGAGSTGIVENVSGDWTIEGDLDVARAGHGEFTQYGGSLTVGGDMYISYFSNGSGVLTIKGGTVTVPSGKSVKLNNGKGTINLDGGTLVTPTISRVAGELLDLNFNGGTLKANAPADLLASDHIRMVVHVNAGGGVIDCGGYAVALKSKIGSSGDTGSLTFTGGNIITIDNEVLYSGATRVMPGTTLAIANATAKSNILANGLAVAGIPTAGQTVFTYTSALDDDDLTKVSCPCAPATTFKFSDEGKTNIVVDVVGSPDWTKYSHRFRVSFPGYTGSETLANFPVLVKISETSISGFRYADCKKPGGADLRFADEGGNLLASEVDTWDETGTSLVWVKVPSLTAATKITAYYGWDFAPVVDSKAVWTGNGYVGVWHLNEASTPLAESSGMSTPFVLPASTQDRTTYEADGVAGGKAVSFDNERYNELNPRLEAADDPDLRGLTNFTVECWTYQTRYRGAGEYDATIIGNRSNWTLYQEATGAVVCRWLKSDGTTSRFSAKSTALPLNEWTHSTLVRNFTGESSANSTMYLNGGFVATQSEINAEATGKVGSEVTHSLGAGDSIRVFPGSIDEVRVSNVARSADWVKASHDTVTESSFATYGSARENKMMGFILIVR